VVDNASSDQTVEELAPRFPQVKFIANINNVGFSAANNQAVKQASGQMLLFLNPDARLLDEGMKKALEMQNTTGSIIGPKILNPDGSLQESVIKIPNCWDIIKEALFLTYVFKNNTAGILSANAYALSGACLLMPRGLFDELGGFDEDLFWMDDVDLCYRARKAGARIVYFNEWTVMHTIGVSSKKNYNKVIANQLISKLKFFRKNKRNFDFLFSAIFIQLHIILRILVFLPLLFDQQTRKKWRAYLCSQRALWSYLFTGNDKVF
jgi:GT2 family glycosyltransferase